MAAYLPDLFLLSVFRKLSAEDRINACQVCTNWYHRVREVNQAVNCLTITVDCDKIENFKNKFDFFNFGYNPSMKQQLMEETNKVDREKLKCSTEWNTLHFSGIFGLHEPLNSTTVQQIITAFSSTTELNFIIESNTNDEYKYLVQLLDTSDQINIKSWGQQLTALRLTELNVVTVSAQINEKLFAAINRLPALKYLAISKSATSPKLPEHLPVLARLKEVRFKQCNDEDVIIFLKSVQRYASDNADLRIDLPYGLSLLYKYLKTLNTSTDLPLDRHIRERIVRVSNFAYMVKDLDFLKTLCTFFPYLTSLSVHCPFTYICDAIFNAISHSLFNLRHLQLSINFCKTQKDIFSPPTTPLHSVKALELNVHVTSHDDVQWLNLSVTMPNVQTIYFENYHCKKCNISACNDDFHTRSVSLEQAAVFMKCFGTVLLQIHRTTTVPLEKITFKMSSIMIVSANQLFLQ